MFVGALWSPLRLPLPRSDLWPVTWPLCAHSSTFLGAILAHANFLPWREFSVFPRNIGEKRFGIYLRITVFVHIYCYWYYFELVFLLVLFFFAGNMANFCERCKHAMSAHDNHASCPRCRVAAGDCSVDPKNPCTTVKAGLGSSGQDWRQSSSGATGEQHWTAACPPWKHGF